ncbi:MAG: DUF480 domain-containing protein [Planctomycetota bacterium]
MSEAGGNAGGKGPVPLNRIQRRVLGVLVEKAFCTPENYPLTANSLLAGCNQKSNRDPVLNLESDAIDTALLELKDLGLAIRVLPATGRTERWKHSMKEAWQLERPQRAVLAELLLRGAQAEGELRARVSRMVEIPTLEELRVVLEELASRGFALRLSPEGRRRGVTWTHCVCSESELERIRSSYVDLGGDEEEEVPASGVRQPAPDTPRAAPAMPRAESTSPQQAGRNLEHELSNLREQVADLSRQIQDLSSAHENLVAEFRSLRDALGS